jgi:predicted RNA binding protein YcfA (HicA-like mRNA interferase family)
VSQFEKLINRIRARPPEADSGDVRKLLEAFGWTFARQTSSHMIFTKPGETAITVPLVSGRKVKRVYLDLIIERLGLDD